MPGKLILCTLHGGGGEASAASRLLEALEALGALPMPLLQLVLLRLRVLGRIAPLLMEAICACCGRCSVTLW